MQALLAYGRKVVASWAAAGRISDTTNPEQIEVCAVLRVDGPPNGRPWASGHLDPEAAPMFKARATRLTRLPSLNSCATSNWLRAAGRPLVR